jgi:putative intracellular protease/amidase
MGVQRQPLQGAGFDRSRDIGAETNEMAVPGQKILFVLTSHATLGTGRKPTAAWLEEFTVPCYLIRDAGLGADIVTTAGVPCRSTRATPARARPRSPRTSIFATELQALVKSTPLVERLVKGRRFVPTAVADGNLITGQNPRSARATAALLLASLRFRHLTERSALR